MLRSLHSADHANMRFSRTIIKYEGDACWIDNVNNNWTADARRLSDNKPFTIPNIRDQKKVDVVPVSLGFCDIGGTARYLSRMPARRTKQGLAQESMFCEGVGVPNFYNDRALSRSLDNTISNNYPCFKECYIKVGKDLVVSQAFHRNWAIWKKPSTGDLCVLFKHFGNVGIANSDGTITLSPEFQYLQETYQEEVVGNV